jgi:ribosomal protein S18 acetylase RimI-like enzyme
VLAVDHRYAGSGIESTLAAHVLATAVELNEKAACRAVVVSALTQRARSSWERLGFHPFDPVAPDQLELYLLTAEVDATLQRKR